MTVTELIAEAVLNELRIRRVYLDSALALSSVTVTVRLQDVPDVRVRAVEFSDQRVVARRGGGQRSAQP